MPAWFENDSTPSTAPRWRTDNPVPSASKAGRLLAFTRLNSAPPTADTTSPIGRVNRARASAPPPHRRHARPDGEGKRARGEHAGHRLRDDEDRRPGQAVAEPAAPD